MERALDCVRLRLGCFPAPNDHWRHTTVGIADLDLEQWNTPQSSGFSTERNSYLDMKIYDAKTLDVSHNGKLQTVSVTELFQLLADGYTPALTEQASDDLKRLMWLTTQIFIQGDWLLQSKWAVPSSQAEKKDKPKPKR